MSSYAPDVVPSEYDSVWLYYELQRVAEALSFVEANRVRLVPQHVAPAKPREGDVVSADGSDWNPGSGAGVYTYVSGAWSKL